MSSSDDTAKDVRHANGGTYSGIMGRAEHDCRTESRPGSLKLSHRQLAELCDRLPPGYALVYNSATIPTEPAPEQTERMSPPAEEHRFERHYGDDSVRQGPLTPTEWDRQRFPSPPMLAPIPMRELPQPAGIPTREVPQPAEHLDARRLTAELHGTPVIDPRTIFGQVGYSPQEGTVEVIAAVCHEANREYCAIALGDHSHKSWDEAGIAVRESVRAGVRNILTGAVRSPEESHQAWLAYKHREGWRYGEVKDEAKRTHPCFVPYGELPPTQQRKDAIFFAIVRALAD